MPLLDKAVLTQVMCARGQKVSPQITLQLKKDLRLRFEDGHQGTTAMWDDGGKKNPPIRNVLLHNQQERSSNRKASLEASSFT